MFDGVSRALVQEMSDMDKTGRIGDTLALATGTRVGASDHAIALFCILYGRVLGLLDFKTLIVV